MDLDRIKARIQEIAANRKNVDFAELAVLLDNHIGSLFPNYNHHGNPHHAFTVGNQTFNVSQPKRGCVKKPYVDKFVDAMEALGMFDPEENP